MTNIRYAAYIYLLCLTHWWQLLLKRNHLTRKNSLLLSSFKVSFLLPTLNKIYLPFLHNGQNMASFRSAAVSYFAFLAWVWIWPNIFYRLWSQNWKISDRRRTKLEVLRSLASRVVGSSRRPRLHVEPGVDLCEQHPPSPGSTTPRGGRRGEAHRRARWHVAAAAWRWWRRRGGEGAGGEEGGEQQHGDQGEQVSTEQGRDIDSWNLVQVTGTISEPGRQTQICFES